MTAFLGTMSLAPAMTRYDMAGPPDVRRPILPCEKRTDYGASGLQVVGVTKCEGLATKHEYAYALRARDTSGAFEGPVSRVYKCTQCGNERIWGTEGAW